MHLLNMILPPDTLPVYSNMGFDCLGHLLEEIAGVGFEDYILENIINPLGLEWTGFDITPEIMTRLAVGYQNNNQVVPGYGDDQQWTDPSGQMYSTANDLGTLMSLFFRDEVAANDTTQVLDGQTLREMQLPVFINNDRNTGFALPFELEWYSDFMTKTKRGDVGGFASEIIMVPEIKFGIVALTNEAEHASPIAVQAAEMMIPVMVKVLKALQPSSYLPSNYVDYLGNYSLNGTTQFTIGVSHLYKYLLLNDEIPLMMVSNNTFQLIPSKHATTSCFEQEVSELLYQLIEFQEDNGDIVSATIWGIYYPLVFIKSVA